MISASAKSSVRRLQQGRFTESDVKVVLIDYRDRAGPILKEIGHFIAHPNRDRGITFDHLLHIHAQFAMFHKYKAEPRAVFPVDGSCDWWLKTLLLKQVSIFDVQILKERLSVKSKKKLLREIKSYFPNADYPIRLNKFDGRLFEIIKVLNSVLISRPAFEYKKLKGELLKFFKDAGLTYSDRLVADIIFCIAVLLHKSKYTLPRGFLGYCNIEFDDESTNVDTKVLQICSSASVVEGRDLFIMIPFLKTDIDVKEYLDPAIIEEDNQGRERILSNINLQFDKSAEWAVTQV